ncbi:hypothetical protein ACFFON_16055 [Arthrobacter citreus]
MGAAAGALLFTGTPPAFAADDHLQISRDGQTWPTTLRGPVFNESVSYVPGASSSATIWVRNSGSEPASLSLAAEIVRSVPELSNYLGMQAGPASDISDRAALGPQGTCTDLGPIGELGAGEARELSFVMDLSIDAPNAAMNQTADVDLLFLLESKDIAPRSACAAAPAETGPGTAELQTLPGTVAPSSSASNNAGIAVSQGAGTTPAGRSPQSPGPQEQPSPDTAPDTAPATSPDADPGIVAAGFQSTVEPIIRSLSGTLLIAMSVVFTAAVALRIRNRRA